MATKNEEVWGCGFLVVILIAMGVIYYSGRWIGWWGVAQPDRVVSEPPAPPRSPFLNKEQGIGSEGNTVHPTNLTALKQKIQDAKAKQQTTATVLAKLKKERSFRVFCGRKLLYKWLH